MLVSWLRAGTPVAGGADKHVEAPLQQQPRDPLVLSSPSSSASSASTTTTPSTTTTSSPFFARQNLDEDEQEHQATAAVAKRPRLQEPKEEEEEGEEEETKKKEASTNDYEADRLRRIQENNRLLAQLGLSSIRADADAMFGATATATKGAAAAARRAAAPQRKQQQQTRRARLADVPRRMSARLAGLGATNYNETGDDDDAAAAGARGASATATVTVTVEQEDTVTPIGTATGSRSAVSMVVPASFTRASAVFMGHRHNVYSQDCTSDASLLAAAGSDALVSIYSLDQSVEQLASEDNGNDDNDNVEEEPENEMQKETSGPSVHEPLAILAGIHKRWICDVQFVGGQRDLLLTASDDVTLVLSRLSFNAAGCSATPVARLGSQIHRSGIFSMHEAFGSVLTSSKDSTVSLSRVSDDRGGLSVVRSFTNAGTSVIKSARWQEMLGNANIFATTGNDRLVRVLDARSGPDDAPAVTFADEHSLVATCVRFSPTNQHQLLSTSFDGTIRLWDARQPSASISAFRGHHGPGKPPLMHPIFDATADHILTGGNGSTCLFKYSTAPGGTCRLLDVGSAPHTISLVPRHPDHILASSGKTAIQLLRY